MKLETVMTATLMVLLGANIFFVYEHLYYRSIWPSGEKSISMYKSNCDCPEGIEKDPDQLCSCKKSLCNYQCSENENNQTICEGRPKDCVHISNFKAPYNVLVKGQNE